MIRPLALLLLFPLSAFCQAADTLSPEDLNIVVSVIRQIDNFGNKQVVLLDSTDHNLWKEPIDRSSVTSKTLKANVTICNELVAGYRNVKKDSLIIDRTLLPDTNTFIVTHSQMLSMSWTDFVSVYPKADGYYSVSPVYHSKDGNYVSFTLSRYCGVLCGEGRTIVAELVDGKWKVVYSAIAWIE